MSSIRFLPYPRFQAFDDNGKPLESGEVFVYAAGTTNKIDTWTDFDKTSKNTNPVVLDSRGEADIFFDKSAKIVLKNKDGVTKWTLDDVQPLTSQTITGKFNLVENGSFELDGDGDNKPDNWTINETTDTSSIVIDDASVAHGEFALKFTSDGGGGGTATSNRFSVADGENIGINFFISSNNTTATDKVDVIFYDKNGNGTSTQNIYTSSGTEPSSLTRKTFSQNVPAGKTQAEVKLTGIDNNETATTFFDYVQALDQGYVFTGTAGEVTADASQINNVTALDNVSKAMDTPTGISDVTGSRSFDTWFSTDSNRATQVSVEVSAGGGNGDEAEVALEIDTNNDDSADYELIFVSVDQSESDNVQRKGAISKVLPPNVQYRIDNIQDQASQNTINQVLESTF